MLKLSLWDLFLGAIPEDIIFIFGVYILTNTIINKKKILITGIISGVLVYLIRFLPIYMGVHLLFLMIIITLLLVFVNKISIVKIIPALLILVITRLVTEAISIFVLTDILNISIESFINNTLLKTLYLIPSLLLFALIVYIIYKTKYNPDEGEMK